MTTIQPNTIYTRNATGALVVVVHVDARAVVVHKLHHNTREKIGSPERMTHAKFLVRYA